MGIADSQSPDADIQDSPQHSAHLQLSKADLFEKVQSSSLSPRTHGQREI